MLLGKRRRVLLCVHRLCLTWYVARTACEHLPPPPPVLEAGRRNTDGRGHSAAELADGAAKVNHLYTRCLCDLYARICMCPLFSIARTVRCFVALPQAYLNRDDVREAIHAESCPARFKECTDQPFFHLAK